MSKHATEPVVCGREIAASGDSSPVEGAAAAAPDSNNSPAQPCTDPARTQLLLHKHKQIGMHDNLKLMADGTTGGSAEAAEMRLQPLSGNTAGAISALQLYRRALTGALSPFEGLYDDVAFPMKTAPPPEPPGWFPPRVKPPKRVPTPAWKSSIKAGPREHRAQVVLSKIWRGIMCRRQQRVMRVYQSVLNQRARVIQCWWRTVLSRIRYDQLFKLKSMWSEKRSKDYVAERLAFMNNMMTWQRSRYEGAAALLQRVLRWYLRKRERQRCMYERDIPESEWPPELKFPIASKKIVYFPWRKRRRRVESDIGDVGSEELALNDFKLPFDPLQAESASLQHGGVELTKSLITGKRTLLQFRKTRELIIPMSHSEVKEENEKVHQKEQERALCIAHPMVQSRLEWKQDNMKQYDLDFPVSVIQRRYLSKRAAEKSNTTLLRQKYMDRAVRIISRTFHMYVLIKRMRAQRERIARQLKSKVDAYNREHIAEIDRQMVWGKELLNLSAATIQRCWHWHVYKCYGKLPERRRAPPTLGDDATPEDIEFLKKLQVEATPEPPPFHLMDSFVEKQAKLRFEALNLLERNRLVREKKHRYMRYTPSKVNRIQIATHLE